MGLLQNENAGCGFLCINLAGYYFAAAFFHANPMENIAQEEP